jgi:multicomponent Na+:H+ antiporter subunit F
MIVATMLPPLTWPLWIGLALASLAFLFVFVRLVRGPTLPDRVVALDMIAYLAIGVIALWTLVSGVPAYLDAAIVLALIAFLATAAFARFVEEGPSGPAARGPDARS